MKKFKTFTDDKKVAKRPLTNRDSSKVHKKKSTKKKEDISRQRNSNRASNPYDADESDPEEIPSNYHQVSIQVHRL
jgi:hypothetical protein